MKNSGFEKAFTDGNRYVRGLWRRGKLFYVQTRLPGKKSAVKLRLQNDDQSDPKTVAQAIALMEKLRVNKRAGKAPVLKSSVLTVADICKRYLDENCPCEDERHQRAGKEPEREARRVGMLIKSPLAAIPAATLTAKDWQGYSIWRKTQLEKKASGIAKGRGGDSVVDHERVTLSNVYRRAIWHSAETGIEINRVTALNFRLYRNPADVVHCREHAPRSGDELHMLARHAFQSNPRSEVLGWFALFTARIGHREAAMLTLRMDAKLLPDRVWAQPGYVTQKDGKTVMYLYRSKTHKGTVGHLEVDAEFQALIDAHRAWHASRYPNSPFYFPSPVYPNHQAVRPDALTQWFAVACPALGLGHRTTHGLRSFRTTCLRSQGKSAAECAELLGQKSAGHLVVEVYGERLDYKVDWMPTTGAPAWSVFDNLYSVLPASRPTLTIVPNQAA